MSLSALNDYPVPPVPVDILDNLKPVSLNLLAYGAVIAAPYQIDEWLDLLEQGELQNTFVYGFDGHGINSLALHYYLVQKHFACFIQLPCEGLYHDPVDVEALKNSYERVAALSTRLEQAADSLFKGFGRLVLVESGFYGSRFGVHLAEDSPILWLKLNGPVLTAAEQWLEARIHPSGPEAIRR